MPQGTQSHAAWAVASGRCRRKERQTQAAMGDPFSPGPVGPVPNIATRSTVGIGGKHDEGPGQQAPATRTSLHTGRADHEACPTAGNPTGASAQRFELWSTSARAGFPVSPRAIGLLGDRRPAPSARFPPPPPSQPSARELEIQRGALEHRPGRYGPIAIRRFRHISKERRARPRWRLLSIGRWPGRPTARWCPSPKAPSLVHPTSREAIAGAASTNSSILGLDATLSPVSRFHLLRVHATSTTSREPASPCWSSSLP